ncbi:hypothetical protein LSTR_LSTR016502 [Laodelphax striatellus]|uniref:Uncharacterized protein n=1 Tax=Laodelphax striatellus TaxID=195883 RepID=A0A482WGH0_LAOST|nr:hypothetical protein LSTR_LSTR016502 [Laodelphax striatellus]
MECDRNMGLINQKSYCEVPDDWITVIANARVKPSPFTVYKCDQSLFLSWTSFFKTLNFKEKCPFPSRPVRELEVNSEDPKMIKFRDTYNGTFVNVSMVQQGKKHGRAKKGSMIVEMERNLLIRPSPLYSGRIAVPKPKFEDLQVLKKFLPMESQKFYENLPTNSNNDNNFNDPDDEVFG